MASTTSNVVGVLTPLQWFMIKAGCIVGSGGILFGYDIGVIAGALGQLTDAYDLSTWEQGMVVSLISAGAVIGCVIGGPLCDYLGRWISIHLQNAIFIAGALTVSLSQSVSTLYIGRLIIGFASALSGIADVAYLTEVSPPEFRGRLSSAYEWLTCVGVLAAFIVDWGLQKDPEGWRVMFAVPGAFALLQSFAMMWLPESPKWLALNGDASTEEYNSVLLEIYGSRENAAEMRAEIEREVAEKRRICDTEEESTVTLEALSSATSPLTTGEGRSSSSSSGDDSKKRQRLLQTTMEMETGTDPDNGDGDGDGEGADGSRSVKHTASRGLWTSMRASFSTTNSNSTRTAWQEETLMYSSQFAQYKQPLTVILILQVLSNVTGGIVIRNYAPVIFEEPGTGISAATAVYLNMFLGVVKLVFVTISVAYVDKVGRKVLLLACCAVIGTGMLVLCLGFLLGQGQSVALFMTGSSLIIAGYSIGFGPVNWIMSTEMFPTSIRGSTVSASVLVTNIGQFITNLFFLPMVDAISPTATFFLFFTVNVASFLYVMLYVTETKELAPEDILANLNSLNEGNKYNYNIDCIGSWNGRWNTLGLGTAINNDHGIGTTNCDGDGENMTETMNLNRPLRNN